MKWKHLLACASLTVTVCLVPVSALDYTVDAPSAGNFGAPTSDETIYIGTENKVNVDKSKNNALIPPTFGTPTSYLPGSGDALTPNLIASGGTVTVTNPSSGNVSYPSTPQTPGGSYQPTGYTAVTSSLYYSGGYLATLKIPSIDLSVKVYEGTSSSQLAKGAGHFTDTSIWEGNVAIAGHNRGVNKHFGNIHTLRNGAKITLSTKLGTRTYAVTDVYKVSETDNSMLNATSENCITLITCVRDQRESRWCVRAVEE